MDYAQALLVARKIRTPAGIHQKRGAEGFTLALFVASLYYHMTIFLRELPHRPTFTHLRARSASVLKQQVIEGRALDLEGRGLTRETAVAKNQFQAFAGIANVKLRSQFSGEARRFQRWQHSHFPEQP